MSDTDRAGDPASDADRAAEHDDVVRRSFEQQGWLFSGPDSPFARRPDSTRAWLEPLDADMIVLDVACGAGHAAEIAAPHVRQVVGIDLTPTLLQLGAARLGEAGIRNVLLQEGNAAALPFLDGSFDLVFCRNACHHFADPHRVLAEMARVCRPGGRVAVADMVAPSEEVRDRFDALHRAIDPSHARVFLEAELATVVEDLVGPLTYAQTAPVRYPFGTGSTIHESVLAALDEELAGGATTGFLPVRDDEGRIVVTFSDTVVHATRPAR